MSKGVAVVYLARIAEGMDAFSSFAKSYLNHDAGYDHDLVVIAKGLTKNGERAYLNDIFAKIAHRLKITPDEGYDIHAYLNISAKLDNEYVLFCNTHTEILSDKWLAKMMGAMSLAGVGMVGATASFESISLSQRVLAKAVWLVKNGQVPFDYEFYRSFKTYIDYHC